MLTIYVVCVKCVICFKAAKAEQYTISASYETDSAGRLSRCPSSIVVVLAIYLMVGVVSLNINGT